MIFIKKKKWSAFLLAQTYTNWRWIIYQKNVLSQKLCEENFQAAQVKKNERKTYKMLTTKGENESN